MIDFIFPEAKLERGAISRPERCSAFQSEVRDPLRGENSLIRHRPFRQNRVRNCMRLSPTCRTSSICPTRTPKRGIVYPQGTYARCGDEDIGFVCSRIA